MAMELDFDNSTWDTYSVNNCELNNWTLSISGFGKIDSAEIEMKPMTIFVGDNNSGKSYLMTLLYGLLTLPSTVLFGKLDFNSRLVKQVVDIIDGCEEGIHQFNGNEVVLLNRLLNQQLLANSKRIIKNLFNREILISDISISLNLDIKYSIMKERHTDFHDDEEYIVYPVWSRERKITGYTYKNKPSNDNSMERLICLVLQYLLRKSFNENGQGGNVIYLPAARTGFMLTYGDLVENALKDRYDDVQYHSYNSLLTKPSVDFINNLARLSFEEKKGEYTGITEVIEKRISAGRIIPHKNPVMNVDYLPFGCNEAMPLYVSSAVVTEITPLLLFLQHSTLGTLFYEEPETSLHPALQKEIARVLIKLKNNGIPIIISTHSDIIIQHMNNMIKICHESDKSDILSRLEYDFDDIVSGDEVCVYQFESDMNKLSVVNLVNHSEYGFEVMTFYDTFMSMSKEIDIIEGDE